MAKFPFGILGPFYGKIGPVTGYDRKGKNIGRSLPEPGKTKKEPTPAQLQQRAKFVFTTRFLSPISDVIKTGFYNPDSAATEFNNAISYNMANAVSGLQPDFVLHYELVSISRGILPNVVLPEAKAEAGGVRFLWADNTGIGRAAATDRAIVAAYCPADDNWWAEVSEAQRSDGNALQVLKASSPGEVVHTWLAFVSADGVAACSVYTGEVVVE